MTTLTFDPVQAITEFNQAYLNGASTLARTDPEMARVLLHLEPGQVEAMARLSPSKVRLVDAIPFALVRPLGQLQHMVEADSTTLLLASFQSTLGRDEEAGLDV